MLSNERARSSRAATPALDKGGAVELRNLFKVLANENRLRILQAILAAHELCVADIASAAETTVPAVSNQLQRLVDQGIVEARRDGRRVYYRVVDCCVEELLDLGTCLIAEGPRRRIVNR